MKGPGPHLFEAFAVEHSWWEEFENIVSVPEHREPQSRAHMWMNKQKPDLSLGEEDTVWWERGERRQWAVRGN